MKTKIKIKKESSFTLLELLIVIAIIAILAAVVLIALNDAKQSAWEARGLQFSQNIKSTLGADLVGEWSFDENTISGNQAKDTSGNNYYLTLVNNPQIEDGKVRDALSLNGGNYAYSPFLDIEEKLLKSKTLEVWFKTTAERNQQVIAGYPYYGAAGNERGFSFQLISNSTRLELRMADGSKNQKYLNAFGLSLNKWYHAVFTQDYENNKAYIYLNGEKKDEEDVIGYYPQGGFFMVGRYSYDTMFFYGLIDEVRIYKRALTAYEVKALYAEGEVRHLAER